MNDAPYFARILAKIDHGKGYIHGQRVGIFFKDESGEKQIGEYDRNYSCFGEQTFCPFKSGEQWYALYSKDYTATRVMSLPDCADVCGEEPNSYGFCPVEIYVPMLTGRDMNPDDPQPIVANHQTEIWATKVHDGKHWRYYWPDCEDHPEPNEERKAAYLAAKTSSHALNNAWCKKYPRIDRYAPFGFIAGCHWGDDSSWKVMFVDLSKVPESIKADARFGYVELPGIPLKDAISFRYAENINTPLDKIYVEIAQGMAYSMDGSPRSKWEGKTVDVLEEEKETYRNARNELRESLHDLVTMIRSAPLPSIDKISDTPADIRETQRTQRAQTIDTAVTMLEKHKFEH